MGQNIFDDNVFFSEYIKLRRGKNYNDLLEQPAMRKLLPDVRGKTVLDIGCGYGRESYLFAQSGAKQVIGVDISRKMLELARREYSHPDVEYLQMDMEELGGLTQEFDLIYSSLAFHYAADFQRLAGNLYRLLRAGGRLLYSQEHPIVTATVDCRGHYNTVDGQCVSYTFSDYAAGGPRVGAWFVDGVENYHRPMGEIVTTLAQAGFVIEELVEPLPGKWALEELPELAKEFIKPTFLIIKARK